MEGAPSGRSVTSDSVSCSSTASQDTEINVSNSDGYLCHISCTATFDCPPATIFAILTNPDNTEVFRDIKSTGYRKVLQDIDGVKVIEVEQRGEFKLLFKKHLFSTFLTVTEDCRDPSMLMTSFSLLRSDVLAKFQGTWQLTPLHKHCSNCRQTHVRLEQDVSPAGVPEFLGSVPVIGNLVKGICRRAVQRVLEDVESIVAELGRGGEIKDILPGACIPKNGQTAARPELESHAVEDCTDSDWEEETPCTNSSEAQ